MKYLILAVAFVSCICVSAQDNFKDETTVNGVFYKATLNTSNHVTYVQQDNFDFPLAADSFYVDEMSVKQWDSYSDQIIEEEDATWNNGMYHTNNGCQVFIHDTNTEDLLVVRLFGSRD